MEFSRKFWRNQDEIIKKNTTESRIHVRIGLANTFTHYIARLPKRSKKKKRKNERKKKRLRMSQAQKGLSFVELKYSHYSVVMNVKEKRRRKRMKEKFLLSGRMKGVIYVRWCACVHTTTTRQRQSQLGCQQKLAMRKRVSEWKKKANLEVESWVVGVVNNGTACTDIKVKTFPTFSSPAQRNDSFAVSFLYFIFCFHNFFRANHSEFFSHFFFSPSPQNSS